MDLKNIKFMFDNENQKKEIISLFTTSGYKLCSNGKRNKEIHSFYISSERKLVDYMLHSSARGKPTEYFKEESNLLEVNPIDVLNNLKSENIKEYELDDYLVYLDNPSKDLDI